MTADTLPLDRCWLLAVLRCAACRRRAADAKKAAADAVAAARARPRCKRSPSTRRASPSAAATTPPQLVLTATLAGGRLQDLTGDVKYEVADAKVVRVTAAGRVIPLANGTTEITATLRRQDRSRSPVTAESIDENLPINFANQIVPIFTKLGCNSRRLPRQGERPERLQPVAARLRAGARLHDPGQGRPRPARCSPPRPDNSLLLLKATGSMAHGGGKQHGGRLRRVQAHPPLDRRRHALRRARRPGRDARSPSTPSTAS